MSTEQQMTLGVCGRCHKPVPVSELVYVAEWTGPEGGVLFADGLRCGKCRYDKAMRESQAGRAAAEGATWQAIPGTVLRALYEEALGRERGAAGG